MTKDQIVKSGRLNHLGAFTTDPLAANFAGVWIGEIAPGATDIQRIAAHVGF